MLHKQIEDEEVIERYVRSRLAPEERRAFEEHFFACDECFDKVQAMEKFVAGVHDAAERGLLENPSQAANSQNPRQWASWAFAGSACAMIVLGIMAAWMSLWQIPKMRQELQMKSALIESQRQTVAQLQPQAGQAESPEANVPLVMLQASRGEEATTATVAPDARQLILWVEIGSTRYRTYRMEVYSASGRLIANVDGLSRGPYGALAAGISAEALKPGTFRIKLIGQTPPPALLVSEYRLQIRRP